jgi:putative peptidoglycan lipid II flippase
MSLKKFLSAGALITIGMLAGRVLGLLRETLIAARFGAGSEADMAIALLIIPDFITSMLLGSAASATLVPAFVARSEEDAKALFWQALVSSLIAFTLIAALILSQGNAITSLMLGYTSASGALLLALLSLPLTAATSVVTAWLQYKGRISVPAFANAIFNTVILLFLWLAPAGLIALGSGILLASLARLSAYFAAFHRSGGRFLPRFWQHWQLRKKLLSIYAVAAGSMMFSLLPQYMPYAIVAVAGSGVALFNYAFKLVLLPGILAQTIVQMVLLPWFVRLSKTHDAEQQGRLHGLALQLAWIVSLAMCLSLSLASRQITALCFGYGQMTPDNIATVARLFAIGVWATPGMLLGSIWQQKFYAHEQTRAPFISSISQAIVIVPLAWMGEVLFGLSGVLLAYVFVQTIPVFILSAEGQKQGIIRHRLPSPIYTRMTMAAMLTFLPLAWIFLFVAPSPLIGLMLAIPIGALPLVAGLALCPPVRQAFRERLAR